MRDLEMTQKIKYDPTSNVEQGLLEKSGRQLI